MSAFFEGLVVTILNIFLFAIVARAILSFVVPMSGSQPHPVLLNINYLVNLLTEPILGPIRRAISRALPNMGALDFSPMVGIIILLVVKAFVRSSFG